MGRSLSSVQARLPSPTLEWHDSITRRILGPMCRRLKAARVNRLQTSLNLALGSALASIGLTIPAVAMVSLATGWTLVLGLDAKGMVLLALSLIVATLSLGTGRTTVLQGAVHLVIFAVYLFTTIVP